MSNFMTMGAPAVEPIGLLLTRAAKAISRAFDDALAGAGGSLPMWQVLVSLKAKEHGAQRTLAEAVGIEGPTLTHHLNRMEAEGLLTRTRDPENRRVHRVELTDAGEAAFHRMRSAAFAFDAQLRNAVSDRELDALRRTLAKLWRNADPSSAGGRV